MRLPSLAHLRGWVEGYREGRELGEADAARLMANAALDQMDDSSQKVAVVFASLLCQGVDMEVASALTDYELLNYPAREPLIVPDDVKVGA